MVTFGNFLTLAEKNLSKGDKEFFFISRARSTAKTHSHKKSDNNTSSEKVFIISRIKSMQE